MKKNLSLIISFIGIVSISAGILMLGTLENPSKFIITLSYIFIGVGCGVFGHGMGNFVVAKAIQHNPEAEQQINIIRNDERNIAIANRAKAKAYDLMTYSFGALLLIFALMGIDLIPLLLIASAYLFIQAYAVYYRIKFDKEM